MIANEPPKRPTDVRADLQICWLLHGELLTLANPLQHMSAAQNPTFHNRSLCERRPRFSSQAA